MALAVSAERTVLWDQFEYDGDPSEFSWVLPVAPGSYLEAANQGFFDALEQATATGVVAPPLNCAQSDSSSGCGFSEATSASDLNGVAPGSDVRVIFVGTVGPYETVTLSSEDPAALTTWLTERNYVIPRDIEPIIAAYVEEGADFIALRLRPNADIQQMTPVRVVTPHANPILPLRMVAAGVGAKVDVVLYVIGEGRFTIPDFKETELDLEELEIDFSSAQSNFEELRERALAKNDGRSLLTTFAQRGLLTEFIGGTPASRDENGTTLQNFRRTYASLSDAATRAAEEGLPNGSDVFLAPTEYDCFAPSEFDEDVAVDDPCYGQTEINAPIDCPTTPSQYSSSRFVCGEHSDLAAALVGLVPKRTWVTRLEMRLPREALDADCAVERVEAVPVGNLIQARKVKNPPCEPALFASSIARRRTGLPVYATLLVLGATVLLLRRRRPRASCDS